MFQESIKFTLYNINFIINFLDEHKYSKIIPHYLVLLSVTGEGESIHKIMKNKTISESFHNI